MNPKKLLIVSKVFIHRIVLPVRILDVIEFLAKVLQPFDVVLQLQIVFAHLHVQVEFYPNDTLFGGCQLLVDLRLWERESMFPY